MKNKVLDILKRDERIWDESSQILSRNYLLNLIDNTDKDLIKSLFENEETRNMFFLEFNDNYIFKVKDFKLFIENNRIFKSYTSYSNRIGLSDGREYFMDSDKIVINFPFKDCILEGGQRKEEAEDYYYEYDESLTQTQKNLGYEKNRYNKKGSKRNEIFYNEVLAKNEIDRLLDDKALINWKRYTKEGENKVESLRRNNKGLIKENLILKGNNLITLHSLKSQFENKIKLIYIDPPYNTGTDSFKYNDNFNHSTWLTFMKNRLEVAHSLLKEDGFIFVQCDDNEQAYLKVLMDEIFGRESFINVITVKTKIGGVSGSSEGKSIRDATEFINVFAKNKHQININRVSTLTPLYKHIQQYIEEGKSWKYTSVITKLSGRKLLKEVGEYKFYSYDKFESKSVAAFARDNDISEEEVYTKYAYKIFRTTNAQSSVRQTVIDETVEEDFEVVELEYYPIKGKNKNKLTKILYKNPNRNMFMFLSDVAPIIDGKAYYSESITTLWEDIQYNNLSKEGEIDFANGKKPEALIKRILDLTTNEGDIVLDFFMGSGSTQAVAMKMNRQFIGIEQMDYIDTIALERLQNVIKGEENGISREVNWQGGGEFIYCELAEWNEQAKKEILEAKNYEQLKSLFANLTDTYFLDYNLNINNFIGKTMKEDNFKKLSLEEQKEIFINMLDLNQLYVLKSEMEDEKYGISVESINLTRDFYEGGK